jgi:hypothetical protein
VAEAQLMSLGCVSEIYCVAISASGDAYTWDGTSWSKALHIDSLTNLLFGISCPAINRCVVDDYTGHVIQLSGENWTQPIPIDPEVVKNPNQRDAAGFPFKYLGPISCPKVNFCVAVDSTGHEITGT